MSKLKTCFKYIGKFFKVLFRTFKARSISTQLIITIVLIFASFFVLQIFLNSQFFKNYYTEQEFRDIHKELIVYVDKMNEANSDYYDEMYSFTSTNNAYSVVTSSDYRILESSFTNYSITVVDDLSLVEYSILIPDNSLDFSIGEALELKVVEYNQSYTPLSLVKDGVETTYNNSTCNGINCIRINGQVTEINKPNNLNYLFEDNSMIQNEISKLSNGLIDLDEHAYEDGYWYRSTDGPIDSLVFLHRVDNWFYIITVVPVTDTTDIINVVSSYNNYVYLTAIVIIFLWSFRLSGLISKPIQNIELVAKEIAALNFNVEAVEYNNKETTSLSHSINLIASNLKGTLDTLNNKNAELTSLYDDQTKQVTLKKQLVSSISHELKTPLMIMQVIIQGILDGIIDEQEQEKELLNVLEEINKSSIMIQDMLQIYRLDDANTKLDISEFNMTDTVEYFIKDFDNVFRSNDLKINLQIDSNVFLEADYKLIKRVVSNFITNAIKYTPSGETISIVLKERDDTIYFELINYGTTINQHDLENIWMPFYRIEHTDSRHVGSKGSGIGLYLVSEILKAHNADFGITNVTNGVKAYFELNKRVEI